MLTGRRCGPSLKPDPLGGNRFQLQLYSKQADCGVQMKHAYRDA